MFLFRVSRVFWERIWQQSLENNSDRDFSPTNLYIFLNPTPSAMIHSDEERFQMTQKYSKDSSPDFSETHCLNYNKLSWNCITTASTTENQESSRWKSKKLMNNNDMSNWWLSRSLPMISSTPRSINNLLAKISVEECKWRARRPRYYEKLWLIIHSFILKEKRIINKLGASSHSLFTYAAKSIETLSITMQISFSSPHRNNSKFTPASILELRKSQRCQYAALNK